MSDILSLESPPAIIQSAVSPADRAKQLVKHLQGIKASVDDNFFNICELLLEAQENNYHTTFGYARFADWIEQVNLDISARQAFYMLTMSKKVRTLGLTRADLKKVQISKLREIFTLDPATQADEMLTLIQDAPSLTLSDVKARVNALQPDKDGKTFIYMTIKVEAIIKETIKEAFELARRNYGSTVVDGEVGDISDTKALELIMISYLQDSNNHPETA